MVFSPDSNSYLEVSSAIVMHKNEAQIFNVADIVEKGQEKRTRISLI